MQAPPKLPGPSQVGDVKISYTGAIPWALMGTTPTLRNIGMEPGQAAKYFMIREKFPGVYPPIEIDVESCKLLYLYIRPLFLETQLNGANAEYNSDPWKRFRFVERMMFDIQNLNLGGVVNHIASAIHSLSLADDNIMRTNLGRIRADILKPVGQQLQSFPGVWQKIVDHYDSAGFKWRYFIFYNDSHPLARVFNGEIPLRPDTFESGTTLNEVLQYESNMQHLDDHRYHKIGTAPNIGSGNFADFPKIAPFLGWRKDALVEAIKKSGLVKDLNIMRFGQPWGTGIKRGDLGFRVVNYPLGDPKRRHPNTDWENITGFISNSLPEDLKGGLYSRTQAFYLTLYRRIFATLDSLKWDVICSNDVIPLDKLRYLAEQHTGIKFDKDNMQNICKVLLEVTAKRRAMMHQLQEDLPGQIEVVVLQPDTPWLNPLFESKFKDVGTALTKPYEQYIFVKALCEDASIDVVQFREKIKYVRMTHLIPGGYEEATKDQLCDYLLEQLQYQAEKYESIQFDCSDPAIRKRHIINTLNIMELGGIFKGIDLEAATKEDLCRIVTNYIATVMEERALTLAAGKVYYE